MNKKILIITSLLTILFSILSFNVEAEDSSNYESVNPSDGFNYGVKRFKEKFFILTKITKNQKSDYYLKLIDIRLSELKYTIEKKDMDNFENSTQRYFTTIGQYTDFLKSKKVSYDKGTIEKRLSTHVPVLEKLRDSFEFTSAEYRFVQDDINYLKNYLNTL